MSLLERKCQPCAGGTKALGAEAISQLSTEVSTWKVLDEKFLSKEWNFPNFAEALAFTNRVGVLAEEEGHHPDIYLTWGKVKLDITTHDVGGLTENDFILAAKCDNL
ncbi:MAG: 4a-hydroxytetrahydrobiopterin dehydratase [Myxococcota bacterium]|nr:4a-hydroxytetrahydrobiopterin dehydratase [Myxococcota bacterium]